MSVRSRIGIGIGMCAMVSLLGGHAVFGQTAPATTERVAALEQRTNELEKKSAELEKKSAELGKMSASDSCRTTDPKCITDSKGIWNALGFQISGTVLASYTQNFNNPQTNNNQLRIFDTDANSFMANLAQIVFERQAVASGSGFDRAGFRARLNFGTDARFSRARTNFQPGTDNNELDVQELYGEYIAPIGNGLKIQAGKINTLIGYEVINAWENPNFSRSFMFGLSQAFTTTGIRFTYPVAKWGTVAIGLINGWDNIDDNNRGKSFEWKVDLTPHEKFGIAFFGSYGPEQSNGNASWRCSNRRWLSRVVHPGAMLRPSEWWWARSSRSSRPTRIPSSWSPTTGTREIQGLIALPVLVLVPLRARTPAGMGSSPM